MEGWVGDKRLSHDDVEVGKVWWDDEASVVMEVRNVEWSLLWGKKRGVLEEVEREGTVYYFVLAALCWWYLYKDGNCIQFSLGLMRL